MRADRHADDSSVASAIAPAAGLRWRAAATRADAALET